MVRIVRSNEVSKVLKKQAIEAAKNPKIVFGYANYGENWPQLNRVSGGIHTKKFVVIASRPKVGKSMLVSGFVPELAYQALMADQVIRLITLETSMEAYQRRMASIMVGLPDPMRVRQGTLTEDEMEDYQGALDTLAGLPIEYISNGEQLTEDQAMTPGYSPVTYRDIEEFIKPDTFLWVLDHIGLVADVTNGRDITQGVYNLSNKLMQLSHRVATGFVITHLTRASVGGMPSIDSLAGSDQVGRNADNIILLWRPFTESKEITEADLELVKDYEPAALILHSREEQGGVVAVAWDKGLACFSELEVPENYKIPLPEKKRG